MLKTKSLAFALVFCFACLSAAAEKWVKLGSRTVNHAIDHDEILVTAKEGTFKAIKLKVKRRAVTFRDLKIHYANNTVQDVALRREIPAGGETREIDLAGKGERVIKKVELWYNTDRLRGRRAVVELWGLR